jgi:hypothetical protein
MGRKCIGERAMTARERAKASQKKLIENGGAVVSLRVSPELADAIADIQRAMGIKTRTKAIEAAIIELAGKFDQPDDDDETDDEYDGRYF